MRSSRSPSHQPHSRVDQFDALADRLSALHNEMRLLSDLVDAVPSRQRIELDSAVLSTLFNRLAHELEDALIRMDELWATEYR